MPESRGFSNNSKQSAINENTHWMLITNNQEIAKVHGSKLPNNHK